MVNYCSNCGRKVENENQKKCHYCNTSFESDFSNKVKDILPKEIGSEYTIVLLIIGFLLPLIIDILIYILAYKKYPYIKYLLWGYCIRFVIVFLFLISFWGIFI